MPTRSGAIGGSWRGNRKSWKKLRVERSGWNLVGRISKLCRYMIDVTGLDPLFFGELVGGGGVHCFGSLVLLDELGKWKFVCVSGTCIIWLDKVFFFPNSTIWGGGAEGREKIRKNEVFLTYEWVIRSYWTLIFRRTSYLRALILNPYLH